MKKKTKEVAQLESYSAPAAESLKQRCARLAIEAYTNGDDSNYLCFDKLARCLKQLESLVDDCTLEANLLLIINKKITDVE